MLTGQVSAHALKPVSYTAALSVCFTLKLSDITGDTSHTQTLQI